MLTKAKLKIMILKMSKMLIFTMILKMSLKMKQKPILEESTSEEINAANKEESDKDEPPKYAKIYLRYLCPLMSR